MPAIINAQQVSNPQDNIPVTPAAPTPVGSYPALYNLNYGEPKLNYIRTWIPDQPMPEKNDNLKHRQQTRYFDGLGRPLQEVNKKAHADGNDIVNHHVYDASGRESVQYLPFARLAHNSQGNFDYTPKHRIEQFYPLSQGEQPYSLTEYEQSPLSRPKKVMAPGKSWVGSGRGVLMNYNPNTDPKHIIPGTNPVHYVIKGAYPKYLYNTDDHSVSYEGNYAEGELFITRVRDEDDHLKEEIKDKSGRLLMSRVFLKSNLPIQFPANASLELNPANYLYTFYIYDELGRLCFVLPPQDLIGIPIISTEQSVINIQGNTLTRHIYNYHWNVPGTNQLNELCYQYRYDKRGRVIEKKIPGKAVEYFVYDDRDRLVLRQDGNLRLQNKWAFGFYDGQNRSTVTGLVTLTDSRASLQTQATEPASFIPTNSWRYYVINYNDPPQPYGLYPLSMIGAEILSYNYFDDYSLVSNSFDAARIPAAPSGDASVVASVKSNATRGQLTGTRVKVLDPDNLTTGQWITTAYYYDAKGRVIQMVSNNLVGGMDYNSQLYYFQDLPYQSVTHHHNPGAKTIPGATATLNHIKLDKKSKRNLGTGGNELVWQLQQSINDGTPYNLAYYDYDHLGRNVIKQFSMVNVLKEYNTRGWLKLIHARNPMYPDSTYFREQLYYDDGFESKLYSGNIAGITWNNYGVIPTNDVGRNAYGYSYDRSGRLIHAEYRNNPFHSGWTNQNKDYTASEITYDDRGNLLTMNQMGNDPHGIVDMDKLNYSYAPNSNKLIKVSDYGATGTTLPDFKDDANLPVEYTYDDNGNLLTDANKAITSITYNHLNKPMVITVDGKGSITYVYDAQGKKLQKRVRDFEAQTTSTWDYIEGFIYKDSVLQYILNEEGRSRPEAITTGTQTGATKFVYDYFIKDHLGNVRTTLAAEPASHEYYAMHELATANSEQLLFDNIASVRDDKPGSINMDDLKAARLNADDPDRRIGTAIMLRVMPGDQFTFATDVYYEADQDPQDYEHTSAEDIVSSLLATLSGGTVGGKPVSETPTNELLNEMFTRPETITGIENILNSSTTSSTAPRAGLNYLFFDEQMNLLSGSGRLSVGPAYPGLFDNLSSERVTTTEPGILVVYVDNQTMGKDVWFDNVQVLHYNTQVLEENHYYPFGLTLSTTAMGITQQPLKYQGIELEKHFGLETYETFYRGLDPQLGRFNSIDPEAEQFYSLSPYVSMNNNPVSYIDPEGDLVFLVPFIIPAIQATLVTLSAYYFYETVKQSYLGSNNYGAPWSSMGTSTTYGTYDPTHFSGFSQTTESNAPVLLNSSEKKEAEVGSEENPHETSRAARRGAMREGGVPTSQPLIKDKDTKSEDEVFITRDGEYTVQNARNDVSHQGKPHWEAGKTKKDNTKPDGLNRSGSNNKPQMKAPKGKSYYKPKPAKTQLPPAKFEWNKT
ncbi:MAG: hypothetical protein JNM21_10350 [Taibaiella sp.]|nr:hypothetical protein [Taibaiella sp.]